MIISHVGLSHPVVSMVYSNSIDDLYLKFPFNSVRLLAAKWTFLNVVGNDPFVMSVKLFVAITNVFINERL